MDKITSHKLVHPVEVGGRKIVEVAIRRPKGRDFRLIGDVRNLEDTGELATLAMNLGGLTAEEFDALDAEDVIAIVGIAGSFFMPRGSTARRQRT